MYNAPEEYLQVNVPVKLENTQFGLIVNNEMTSVLKNAGVIHKMIPTEIHDTGKIIPHYRISQNYALIENVFVGEFKSFVSGYELWDRRGYRIQVARGIREMEYDKYALYRKILDELSAYNVHSFKRIDIDLLELFRDDDFMTMNQFKIACNELIKHSYIVKTN